MKIMDPKPFQPASSTISLNSRVILL